MKPIDLRNATWHHIRQDLQGRLSEVYTAWVVHGPCTTRELAQRSGIDILNVRPRTTDLASLGLVELLDRFQYRQSEGRPSEGIYRARTQPQWESWLAAQRDSMVSGQLNLI